MSIVVKNEDEGIKTFSFLEGRKVSTRSTILVRRTSLNNIRIGKPFLFVVNLLVISIS